MVTSQLVSSILQVLHLPKKGKFSRQVFPTLALEDIEQHECSSLQEMFNKFPKKYKPFVHILGVDGDVKNCIMILNQSHSERKPMMLAKAIT